VIDRDELRLHSFWWFQAGGWGCFYLLSVLVVLPCARQPGDLGYPDLKGLLADQGLLSFAGFTASLVLRPVCRALVRKPLSWMVREIYAAGSSLLIGTSTALLVTRFSIGKPDPIELLEAVVNMSVLLFLWCNLYFSIKESLRRREERERLLRAEAEATEAHLRALRYQLNPHFLFNSMNAVSSLVAEGNAAAATKMLAHIAEFLRATLDGDVVAEGPLSQEMLVAQRYLAIEQTRFQGRLSVDFDVPSETLDALVPTLLLQPLVENAVRHGIAPLVDGGTIAVRSELRDSRLLITVRNSACGDMQSNLQSPRRSTGIGLTNTAERLRALYGSDHKFELAWPSAGECPLRSPFASARRKWERWFARIDRRR
jgi:two-component system, LytTR family, sensor kinase